MALFLAERGFNSILKKQSKMKKLLTILFAVILPVLVFGQTDTISLENIVQFYKYNDKNYSNIDAIDFTLKVTNHSKNSIPGLGVTNGLKNINLYINKQIYSPMSLDNGTDSINGVKIIAIDSAQTFSVRWILAADARLLTKYGNEFTVQWEYMKIKSKIIKVNVESKTIEYREIKYNNYEMETFVGTAITNNGEPLFIWDFATSEPFYLDSLKSWDSKYLNKKITVEGVLIQCIDGKSVIKDWKIIDTSSYEKTLFKAFGLFNEYSFPNSMARPKGFDINKHVNQIDTERKNITKIFHSLDGIKYLNEELIKARDEVNIICILKILSESNLPQAKELLKGYLYNDNKVISESAKLFMKN
jgi:hypothetical protein